MLGRHVGRRARATIEADRRLAPVRALSKNTINLGADKLGIKRPVLGAQGHQVDSGRPEVRGGGHALARDALGVGAVAGIDLTTQPVALSLSVAQAAPVARRLAAQRSHVLLTFA